MKGKDRESNFELLRMVAMFMILVVHGNFGALGAPSKDYICQNPFSSFVWIGSESLSIVCVSVFVLISGWFGIRPTLKGVMKFLFQIFFFNILIYTVAIAAGKSTLTVDGLMNTFLLSPLDYFIKSYLFLFILAPVLNTYVENAKRNTQKKVLIYFFVFQTVMGWVTKGATFFLSGYSVVSFVGLYLLARYCNVFSPKYINYNRRVYLTAYFICTLCITIVAYISIFTGISSLMIVYNYTCPFGILASLSLLLFFSKLSFKSKFINWAAESCFSIYLFHRNFNIFDYYQNGIRLIFRVNSGLSFLAVVAGFMFVFVLIAICIDQIRKLCWYIVSAKIR